MFSWWSSLGPEKNQSGEKTVEKNAEGELKTEDVSKSDSAKAAENEKKEKNQESASGKTSELDYARDMAKNVGSFLFNVASVATNTAYRMKDTVKETVEKQSIIEDFNKKQEEFVKEKHKRKESAVPPWVGYNEEKTMKNQILALSKDERNFLRDPPAGVPFIFDSDSMYPVALATLQEDKNLSKMRFQLVPKKIKEDRFWRNYFYRVSLIKQSTQLTSLAAAGGNGASAGSDRQSSAAEAKTDTESGQTVLLNIPGKTADAHHDIHEEDLNEPMVDESSMPNEFISDSFAHHTEQELSHDDLRQIGVDKKQDGEKSSQAKAAATDETTPAETPDDIPEWEKELQAELQDFEVIDNEENAEWEKEIEDMLEEEDDKK